MEEDRVKKIVSETAKRISELVQDDLERVILFGSYARGDFTKESDIDIAVLVMCDREGIRKYKEGLVRLSSDKGGEDNRAYYSFEKAVKALLALKAKDAKTHSGVLHLFNSEYVYQNDYFTHED